MEIQIPLKFVNEEQEQFFLAPNRNACFCGGFGNGKTYVLCLKALFFLVTFPRYRVAFVRQVFKDLRRTTMATFYAVCPEELYAESSGGRRSDNDGYCKLINGAEIFFLGVDNLNEKSLKSFELNSIFVDQAEEIDWNIYDILDSRVGRWSHAEIPASLSHLDFPLNSFTNRPIPPSYLALACNPDTTFHWIYRLYHEDSEERRSENLLINCPSTHNPALHKETLQAMLSHDPEWVARYVYGQWGVSEASIHTLTKESIIEPSADWLKNFLLKSRLYRVLDHGDASPTCCLWFANWDRFHICYREYYQPNALISEHRQSIQELSGDEVYAGNYADPAIFKKNQQKYGGMWSIADDYLDRSTTDAATVYWQPADNNELVTRNRINELIRIHPDVVNPASGVQGSPLLFFIRRNEIHPNACYHVTREISAQRRELIGYENGRAVYSDDRKRSIADHSYDCVRYYVALKAQHFSNEVKVAAPGSFYAAQQQLRRQRFTRTYSPLPVSPGAFA